MSQHTVSMKKKEILSFSYDFHDTLVIFFVLLQVCTGQVTVEVIPGNHMSFLVKESGAQVASILNSVLCPENES